MPYGNPVLANFIGGKNRVSFQPDQNFSVVRLASRANGFGIVDDFYFTFIPEIS